MIFNIEIQELSCKTIGIEAKTREEAIKKAEKMYYQSVIKFDVDDVAGTHFVDIDHTAEKQLRFESIEPIDS